MEKCFFKIIFIGWFILGSSMLSSCQEKPNKIQEQMNQQMIIAVESGNHAALLALLENKAEINSSNAAGESLLLLATQRNDFPMVQLLLKYGADVNQQAHNLDSPFLYAGASGHTELLKLYLAHGARFDIFNRYHGTALIPACERGHLETVTLLANTANFPINHVNRLGWTALMEAVILGDGSDKYVRIVDTLIQAGVDKNIPDNKQITALEHAKKLGYQEIVDLLN